MARKEKKVELPERDELIALAEEMNEVLQLAPALKITKKMSDEDIVEAIKEQAEGNIYEIDFTADENDDTVPYFSEEAKATIEALEIEVLEGAPAPKEEEPEEAEEEEEEEPAKKGKKDEKPVKEEKKAAAKKDEKPAKKAEKPAKAKKEKKEVEKKFTRDMAVIEAIKELCKKGATFKDIMDRSDAIYVEEGGKSVPDAVNVNKYTLNGLVAFDVLEVVDGKYKFKK